MSTLKVTNIQDTSGGNSSTSAEIFEGRARAWCNADLTGSGSIRSSYNVNSLTDQGTGRWSFNFTTAFPNTNYVAIGLQKPNADVVNITGLHPTAAGFTTYGTSTVSFAYANSGGSLIDPLIGTMVVFSDD